MRQCHFAIIIKQCSKYKHEQVGYFLATDKLSGEVVGYILKKSCWHKGYAAEGAVACLKYGFDLFDIPKIVATIRPENSASIAVAERKGMNLVSECDKQNESAPRW